MSTPPRPSARTTADLIVQAVERVEELTMFRLYRLVFELCWHHPSSVIAVLNSLETGEWKRAVREPPADPAAT